MECKTVTRQAALTVGNGRTKLVVMFERVGDRFAHYIQLDSGSPGEWLQSAEGNDQQNWPPSPPFQEAMTQEQTVLLVGMAGHGHWSGSVEAIQEPTAACLVFDIACRTSGTPDRLGSRYLLTAPGDRPAARIQPLDINGSASCSLTWTDSDLTITPRQMDGPFPGTIRWKYRILLTK